LTVCLNASRPLASVSIPVFVASTPHADLVFVPADQATAAIDALRTAGHEIAAED